jgi:hypothetical protein
MSERDDDRHLPDELDPDAPASADEIAASQRLRDALAGGSEGDSDDGRSPELELARSLRAAWAPSALSTDENRAVLDAAPSAEEQARAGLLRDALAMTGEPDARAPSAARLAHALRAAFAPAAIDDAEHRAMVDAALAKMPAAQTAASGGAAVVSLRPRNNVVRLAFGFVAGGLALAASVVFVVTSAPMRATEAPLARARTTQPLFSEPFKPGETSARIDRIASARASDFRDNRFARWGVR